MGVVYNWNVIDKKNIVRSYLNSKGTTRSATIKIARRYQPAKLIGGKYEIIRRGSFNPKKHLVITSLRVSEATIVNVLKERGVYQQRRVDKDLLD